MKKKILVTVGEDIIARNVLFTDFLPALLAGTEVIIATLPKRVAYMKEAVPEATIVSFERTPPRFLEKVVSALLHKAVVTEVTRWYTWHWVTRGDKSYLYGIFERFVHLTLGKMRFLHGPLVALFERVSRDEGAHTLLAQVAPDAVLALSLTHFHFDIPLAIAAKQKNIRLIGMVRSWDNLVTHGTIRVIPDIFIFQNEYIRQTARDYQPLPERLLSGEPVGLPHYDSAARDELLSREETFAHFGLDLKKKLILYGAMGDSFRFEAGMLPMFDELARAGAFPADAQFFYRPHPTTSILGRKELQPPTHVIVDKTTGFVGERSPAVDREGGQARRLFSLIAHADVVLATGSTFVLDAAALNRPTILLDFDPPGFDVPYWVSVKRVFDHFTHFMEYVKTNASPMAHTPEEIPKAVADALTHPGKYAEGRKRAVELFLAPLDGKAGCRLADRVLSELAHP